MPTATIALGSGTNGYTGEGCDDSTATVSGGSGQDGFTGSSDGATSERLFGGGGDDRLQGYAGNDEIHGDEGDDVVDGGEGDDGVFGEGGSDQITGRGGNDTEDGGPGDDSMGASAGGIGEDNDQGADDVRGGDGNDSLTLEDHTGGVTIRLDGQANDGAPGEGDNIASDLETITGTSANDVFFGTEGRDTFSGNPGSDEIHGAGGNDELSGGSGDDRMFGDTGNDKVQGYEGSDTVDGGPGSDELYGDRGSCSVFCTFDADTLLARDGERDTVDCGGGADSAQVDGLDIVAFCASVDRQNPAGAGAPGGATSAASLLALKVGKSVKLKTLLRRGLAVRLRCAAACKVAATLSYKGKRLGSGRRTLRKAGTARLVVTIGTKARQRVRRLRGKKLALRIKVTSAGKTTTLARKVTLKR